jgi:hypothetical protein
MEPTNELQAAINTDRVKVSQFRKDIKALIDMLKERKKEIPDRYWVAYLDGVGLNRLTAHFWLNPANGTSDDTLPENGMSTYWRLKLAEQLDLETELGEDGMEEATWESGSNADFVALLVTAGMATWENVAKMVTPLPNEDCSRWKLTKQAYAKLAGVIS